MIEEHAPAKLNLALHVVGERADGYHLIETLVVFCEEGDRIRVAPAAEDSFKINGRFAADLAANPDNLVSRARDALRMAARKTGFDAPSVAIELQKSLPVASGLGGGSADAAATFRALSRLWGIEPTMPQALASTLGADVPMCLAGRPLVARGIGDRIEAVPGMPALPVVLVNPGIGVATPDVFRALRTKDNGELCRNFEAARRDILIGQLSRSRNDLQAPAIAMAPAIGEALEALEATAPLLSRMSGSGATCFGIYETDEAALDAANAIEADHPGWYVKPTRSIAA